MIREYPARKFFPDGTACEYNDILAEEVIVEIQDKDKKIHRLSASPSMEDELRAGFLFCSENDSHSDFAKTEEMMKRVSTEKIMKAADTFLSLSENSQKTGALHSAALFDGNGLLFFAEDISRHNAILKSVGGCLLELKKPCEYLLFTSGRISSSVVEMADGVGIGVIVSKGAVTAAAAQMGKDKGMKLFGFASKERINYYG